METRYDGALEASGAAPAQASGGGSGQDVRAEMPGRVIRLVASTGAVVKEGDVLLILEAMKMEMQITSPYGGTVQSIPVAQGDQVAGGDVLAIIG